MLSLHIIIINWNSWDKLQDCLTSIQLQKLNTPFQITIIDNASKQNNKNEILQKFINLPLEVIINQKNLGFSKAVNQALKLQSARYHLLLNPDTVVEENSIQQAYEYLEQNKNIAAIGPKLQNEDKSPQKWAAGNFPRLRTIFNHYFFLDQIIKTPSLFPGLYLQNNPKEVTEVDWLCGAFLMICDQALQDVGNLDENYYLYGEDIDWCYRCHQKNWKIVYHPQITITHLSGKSIEKVSKQRYHMGLYGFFFFIKKHHGPLISTMTNLITTIGFFIRVLINSLFSITSPLARESRNKSIGFFKASIDILFKRYTWFEGEMKEML